MIRWLRYLFLGTLAIALVTLALANRSVVRVQALPDDMAAFLGLDLSAELPLFLVIFGAIVVGLMIGFAWEWLREHRYRADARAKGRDVSRLERELAVMRDAGQVPPQDDVLAILDQGRR
ncbi:lipopolysaccharide assembly protein LapA domain-containing protein [Neogemmobacter tilapiae]|uniref:Phosphoribosylanthranilate isomerase n=1 Tax=Neogemmobacter tilapiae TaxID=875041 RepID=A0A918TM36_9RHOB|nr:LapA family protein [Gemmobacter tilapiae]GHC54244.1 phosphoribosylanthranilate isomerase [Gemmobacter tilapiae]